MAVRPRDASNRAPAEPRAGAQIAFSNYDRSWYVTDEPARHLVGHFTKRVVVLPGQVVTQDGRV